MRQLGVTALLFALVLGPVLAGNGTAKKDGGISPSSMTVGERNLTVTPFGEIRRFTDTLEFVTESGAIFDVQTQYELGLEFSTDPRKRILGIALPRLRLTTSSCSSAA